MANTPLESNTVIMISREGMGSAELSLQHKLIATYLKLLDANGNLPAVICFYTDGVKLVVEGSPVIEELKALEAHGVRLIVCQTCLNYFNLTEKVQVGIIGGMGDILEAQWKAEKVITL